MDEGPVDAATVVLDVDADATLVRLGTDDERWRTVPQGVAEKRHEDRP